MLKFDSLELFGFKSFSERTRVTFHERLTAVIGPNGCGKSNLSDAIGWVLGAQTAKNLRGQRMDDFIFNGTDRRKPSGLAEVTLTLRRLDDAPLILDGEELSEDVLEITRKLYRDGESHYLINQRRSRLKDIHQFLDDAGLGFAPYALIAQGKIDSFLTSKPLDRRVVIEEAAQIMGYKSRRRSAELKLEMAQQNLLRVADIIAEVERQLRSLKRQAAKARKYRRLKEEFRRLLRVRFAMESVRLGALLEDLNSQLAALREQEEGLREQLENHESEHREGVRRREALEHQLAQLRERRSEVLLELDRTRNSIGYHVEQVEITRSHLGVNAVESESITQSLQAVEGELAGFEAERDQLEKEAETARCELRDQQEQATRYGREVREAEAKLEDLRQQLLRLSAETASLKNTRELLEQRLSAGLITRQRLERERSDHEARLVEDRALLQEKESLASAKHGEIVQLRDCLELRERKRKEREAQLEELRQETSDALSRLIAHRERLQSLQEVELNHSQYSEGVQKVLHHLSRNSNIRLGGTLADFLETSPEFEHIVEEFLDEELEYVLVDSLDEAVRGVRELRNLKSGKCTFLTLHSTNGFGKGSSGPGEVLPLEAGIFGRLEDLVQLDPEVGQAFQRVLPQRAQAVVVSDLDKALSLAHSLPEATFITLEGEELTPRGLLAGTAGQSRKLGLLSLKRQKRELEQKITRQQKLLADVEERLAAVKSERDDLVLECAQNLEELTCAEKELISCSHQKDQASADVERRLQALNVVGQELDRLEVERSEQIDRRQSIECELQAKNTLQVEVDSRLREIQSMIEQLRVEHGRVLDQLNAAASDCKVIEERRQALDRTLERVREQHAGLQARRNSILETQAQNERRLDRLAEELEGLRAKRAEFEQDAERLGMELAVQETEFAAWKEGHQQVENALSELRDQRSRLQEERARADIERARVETHLLNLQELCREQLRIPLEEAVGEVALGEVNIAETNARHDELRRRLERFGPINMTALQEYQENEERFQFLTRQRQDIEASIADTTKAIQEINRRSRELFRQAFEAINIHFKEVFQKLFGGGECGMQLLDEEDVLECGIDLYAQPPGKKLQNVMLLSGGEKAMTVFALLMALFMFRPSRFCVLDEVDAPLDDANIRRFGALVTEMSERTQFILVTHNKRTMEIADTIFGVTMEEPGISKVVSAKF